MPSRIVALCLTLGLLAVSAVAQPPGGARTQSPSGQPPLTPDQIFAQARELKERASARPNTPEAAQLLREAMQLLIPVLQRDPGNIEANLLGGEIALEGNDYDRARVGFMEVLKTEPGNYRANLGVGKVWIGNRYWRQAISYLETAERVAPEASRPEVKRLLAMSFAGSGQIEKAVLKAKEAVQSDPTDLEALQTLVQIRLQAAKVDPLHLPAAVRDGEFYLRQAMEAVKKSPWDRNALIRLITACQTLVSPPPNLGVLQAFHNSFYETVRDQPTDQLKPGKGPDAGAVLMRMAEVLQQQSLINMILTAHDAILMAERATSEQYAPTNVKYLEVLLASYQHLQELTARLVGQEVYRDTTVQEQAVETCRKILEVDPNNETAQQYLRAVGVAPTPPSE